LHEKHLLVSILSFISLGAAAQVLTPKLDSLVSAYVAINKFNGTAVIVREGKVVYEKSYGYENATAKTFNSKRSIFPIGSLTKSFTALIVLKLAAENKLSLDNPVSQYIPGYPRGNDIKIKHLLTNSSGVYEKFRNRQFAEQLPSRRATGIF
jgi:CubicO group peptidase (beta-lactamase class C family)